MTQIETVPVTWDEVKAIWAGYKAWSSVLKKISWVRSANMPEGLSEALVCLCTDGLLIRSSHGDVLLPAGEVAEVKATSLPSDTPDVSSFSPVAKFANLYFVERVEGTNDEFYVYDLGLNRTAVERLKMNARQTFKDQADAGRRPRFSIRKLIVRDLGRSPTWHVDLNAMNVVRLP